MKNTMLLTLLIIIGSIGCDQPPAGDTINLRLRWAYQAQFAGYLVAQEKGFYNEEGLTVGIQPAGPDLKPHSTVAAGTDDIGVGIITQLISARSNDVPLVAISQIFQDSPDRFVLKRDHAIDSLAELKGKRIGVWIGGDEIEIYDLLRKGGLSTSDVEIVPQKFSVAPFLAGEYEVSQVMTYNELLQIQRQGYDGDKLQIISPKDHGSAVLGDLLFATEAFVNAHPERVKKFLRASFRGWRYAAEHPDETVAIITKFNPESNAEEQRDQLQAVLALINTGHTLDHGIGYMNEADYQNAKQILLGSMSQSSAEYTKVQAVDVSKCYTTDIWEGVDAKDKQMATAANGETKTITMNH